MRRLFLESDDLGTWLQNKSWQESWNDHGQGILVTLAIQHGYPFDVMTLKSLHSWAEYRMRVKGYDLLCMNVRSWRYTHAKRAAEIFKKANPDGQVWAGGMHATVALAEMEAIPEFDVIVKGEGEGTFLDLLANDGSNQRVIQGSRGPYDNLDDLPWVDREAAWPKDNSPHWPLESSMEWGRGPVAATMMTSRACPYKCSFCAPAEYNHFGPPRRRSVGSVIGELNMIDERWGPFSSIVFHEGEWFINPHWLEEFHERYPRETKVWPFWSSCRADLLLRWPDLVEAIIRDCNWHCLSIGLESGSQKVLDIMNKGTTPEQNDAAIDMINRIGDDLVAGGKTPPVIFANAMLAVPGEEPEDAFATMRMLGRIKRCLPSISWFSPYPGSKLGDRIIAEGRSLDTPKRYKRYPDEPKVLGVDYGFYRRLASGVYDCEVGFSVPELLSRQSRSLEALL